MLRLLEITSAPSSTASKSVAANWLLFFKSAVCEHTQSHTNTHTQFIGMEFGAASSRDVRMGPLEDARNIGLALSRHDHHTSTRNGGSREMWRQFDEEAMRAKPKSFQRRIRPQLVRYAQPVRFVRHQSLVAHTPIALYRAAISK